MPVTVTFSTMVAPPLRAPRAIASVVSIGFVRPSPGIHTAPARSSVRISGHRRPASAGEITSMSTPKHRAIDAPRFSSISRSAVRATLMLPERRKPGGLSGLRFEALVEDGAVPRQAGQVVTGAQLSDETGGMPGGSTGQLAPLQQHDVAPAELRQVVRDAAADDAAADDDDTRVRRDRARHRRTIAHR